MKNTVNTSSNSAKWKSRKRKLNAKENDSVKTYSTKNLLRDAYGRWVSTY